MKAWSNKQEIENKLQQFADNYAKRNFQGVLNLFCKTQPMMLLGTGEDEWCDSLVALEQQITRDWSQSEHIHIDLRSITSHINSNTAWICADSTITVTINNEKVIYPSIRNTHVLIKENGDWRFALSHWSLPASDQRQGRSFPGQ